MFQIVPTRQLRRLETPQCSGSQEADWSHDRPTICIPISDVGRVCFHLMKTHKHDVKPPFVMHFCHSDLADFAADRLFPGLFGDTRQHERSRITLRLCQVFAEF